MQHEKLNIVPSGIRRWVRAPYAVKARLEFVGRTDASGGIAVQTCDANAWGVRLQSQRPLIEGAEVRLSLPTPDGRALKVFGSLVSVSRDEPDTWHASIVFDIEQPELSAARIDAACFGG